MQLLKGPTGISALRSWVVKIRCRKQYLATESLSQAADARKQSRLRREWTADETAELIRLRSSGVLLKDLPSHFIGRSYDSIIKKWCRLAQDKGGNRSRSSESDQLHRRCRKRRRLTQDERKDVVALRRSGYSYTEIAARLGLDNSVTVRLAYLGWDSESADPSRPRNIHVPWSHEEDTLLWKLRSDGLTQKALIPYFRHRSVTAILSRVCRLESSTGEKPRGSAEPRRLRTWSDDEDIQLETLCLQGRKVPFIAKEIGRTARQVSYRMKKQRLVRPRIPDLLGETTVPGPGG